MSSNIESHSKLLKDDPNVEMVGGPKSKAQPVMHLSDVNFFFDISDVSSPLIYFIGILMLQIFAGTISSKIK